MQNSLLPALVGKRLFVFYYLLFPLTISEIDGWLMLNKLPRKICDIPSSLYKRKISALRSARVVVVDFIAVIAHNNYFAGVIGVSHLYFPCLDAGFAARII